MTEYVYGLSKSGLSVIKLLKLQKKTFHCWDDNKKIRDSLKKKFLKLHLKQISTINLEKYNNIYITPGVSIFDEKFSKVSKSKIKRDLNLYYKNLKNEKVVAITGTNGKSTTTKLIGDLLKRKSKNTFVGGNIGDALCNSILHKSRFPYHVIELSSFQLETIKNFEPKISILLNLSKDHLDRYKNFKDYINAKKNIVNSKNKNINLISIDDKYCKKIFNDKKITHVYQSSDRVYYNDKINKSKDYILHIGTFEKRKDLLTLVKAFELFKDNTNSNLKLVLAGSKSFNGKKQVYKEIKRYILKKNLISFIIMPGYINKKQAIYYYNNAFAYVFPSIDEGFGIPLIEAMKARIPVLCSDIEIFKEIGDDSVVYFKKQDYNDLSNQLKLLHEDKIIIDRLVSKGSKRANLFTQKKFIKGFEKLY